MLASIADGPSRITNPLMGDDCMATTGCLRKLGVDVVVEGNAILVHPSPWVDPDSDLDCGNSGTTMRLISGLIASRKISATLIGDVSLSKRPMRRIVEPLRLMGAQIEGEFPPISIRNSGELSGIEYRTPVASAQIKSCILLAALRARGTTTVIEPEPSRDHTERMLAGLGVAVRRNGVAVSIDGGQEIDGFEFFVPGDISSAAFAICAASMIEGSAVHVRNVGVNKTRCGLLDVLRTIGCDVELSNDQELMGEPFSDLTIKPGNRRSFALEGTIVPRLIDEIPVLAVLATQLEGKSTIRDASELRVKESDRIELVANGLRAMGARVETFDDGLAIEGPNELKGTLINACHDHRIAMAFAVAGLVASGETMIEGEESIATSYPSFLDHMNSLGADMTIC